MPPPLPELSSPKAARILAAAGELLRNRGSKGLTVADVAQRAHVGKGTVYLYWDTKEDLLLGLIGRDFLAVADEYATALTADPDLARPSRLCPRMLRVAVEHQFVGALQSLDDGLLGALADDPRSAMLLDTLGPSAVLRTVLPSWRSNRLARTDWAPADQAFALQALTTGVRVTSTDRRSRSGTADPEQVLAAAVTALLGPERASPEQIRTSAADVVRFLTAARSTTIDIIGRPALAAPDR